MTKIVTSCKFAKEYLQLLEKRYISRGRTRKTRIKHAQFNLERTSGFLPLGRYGENFIKMPQFCIITVGSYCGKAFNRPQLSLEEGEAAINSFMFPTDKEKSLIPCHGGFFIKGEERF